MNVDNYPYPIPIIVINYLTMNYSFLLEIDYIINYTQS